MEKIEQNRPVYTAEQKRANRRLGMVFWILFAVCFVLFCLGRTGCIPSGVVAPTYGLQMLCVLPTIVVVPCALKLLNFTFVKKQIVGNLTSYQRWAFLRMGSLYLVLLADLLLHFLMNDDSAFYCCMIMVAALMFVVPCKKRLSAETSPNQ